MKKHLELPPITKPLAGGEQWEAYLVVIAAGESRGLSFAGFGETEAAAIADARRNGDQYLDSSG